MTLVFASLFPLASVDPQRAETWLRASLSAVWIWTALAVLHPYYRLVGDSYLHALSLPSLLMYLTCAAELGLGIVVLVVRPVRWLVSLQAALVLSFSLILALKEPLLLASPFGMLSKNLQFLCVLYVLFLVEKHGSWTDLAKRYLRIGMAVVWLTEGLFPKLLFQQQIELQMVPRIGIEQISPSIIVGAMGVAQILSAVLALVLSGKWLRLLLLLQAGALLLLPLLVGFLEPSLYVHPFGPFSKNLPIFVGTLVVRKQCGGLS